MRSKVTIVSIVLGAMLGSLGILVLLIAVLGPWAGLPLGLGLAALVLLTYRFVVQPWHQRWGATDEETERAMPGDEVIPRGKVHDPGCHDQRCAARGVAVARSDRIRKGWLVQLRLDRQ
jgi:hypothetical protein